MPEPPRRKRFQIHLSTAIVMMFVAGGLMWANVTPSFIPIKESLHSPEPLKLGWIERGWPFRAHVVAAWSVLGEPHRGDWGLLDAGGVHPIPQVISDDRPPSPATYFLFGLACDVTAAIAILFGTWFLCEWLIRRRAART